MTDHHIWNVIKRPKQHIPAIVGTIIIVGALTALTVFTANTHTQTANVKREVDTNKITLVRSFCTHGITEACKKKAFTLIRGCLAYAPCRELLVKGPQADGAPSLKQEIEGAKVETSGVKATPVGSAASPSGGPPAATTTPGATITHPVGSGGSPPVHHPTPSHHHEQTHHPKQEQPQGSEQPSGGSTPESGGGSPPASAPEGSGGGSPPVAEAPSGESPGSGGGGEETPPPSNPITAAKGGLEEVVGGVGHVVEETTAPLCEVGVAGIKVCLK